MKFFIAISGLTLVFGFSIPKLFIFRYKKLINHCKLDEGTYMNSLLNVFNVIT